MKKLYYLPSIDLIALSTNPTSAYEENVKTLYKQTQQSPLLHVIDTAFIYGYVGLGLKSIGATFHKYSGHTPYEYNITYFGQPNALVYPKPQNHECFTKNQQYCSYIARQLLTLGSISHWPLRSIRDFTQGVLFQTKYIALIKNDITAEVDINKMRSCRNQALLRTPVGIAALIAPSLIYHHLSKQPQTTKSIHN